MHSSFIPPRQVSIDDAAAFIGTTPEAIRRYHQAGLLSPEPGAGERQYAHDDVIRLLWIHKMADAGITLGDIRSVFEDQAPANDQIAPDIQRLRTPDGRIGLLSGFVATRLAGLPEGSLRQADLDSLLVSERIFSPLGAAIQAGRFITVATRPDLREESDRIDAAEEALDDTVDVDDPRVAQVAAQRHAFERKLNTVIDESGLAEDNDAVFEAWDVLHSADADDTRDGDRCGTGPESLSVLEALGKMPYDFSPARLRCMELAEELAAADLPAT